MPADPSAEAPTVRRRYPRAVRYEQLLDVAEALYVEHGYAGVSMEDIARAAGVTRPIVYNHFETREGAYLAVVRRAREQYDAQIVEAAGSSELGPKAQLAGGAEVFFGLLEREPGRWRLIFGSSAVLPESRAGELSKMRFGTIATIEAALRISAPHAPALAITMAAHSISGVGERLGLLWLDRPELRKSDLIHYYVELMWNGMRPYVEIEPDPRRKG